MTNQEAFDTIVQWLRTQGSKSEVNGRCFYRHPDGLRRCALGILISDDHYNAGLEGFALPAYAKPFGVSGDLLFWMQQLHDAYSVAMWEANFMIIAKRFKLTVPRHPLQENADATDRSLDESRSDLAREPVAVGKRSPQ